MEVNAYVTFDGNCREAFTRYAEIFGGEIAYIQTFGDSPEDFGVPKEMHDRIMHSSITIGDGILMGSDDPTGNHKPPSGIHLSVNLDDVSEARRIFDLLAEGGNVTMPFDKTFWADGFGMVTDRFDVPWLVNCNTADQDQ